MASTAKDEPLLLESVTVFGEDDEGEPVARLREISLKITRGEWLNVVGVNGSGKSTLARLLAGIRPGRLEGRFVRGFAGEGACPIVLQQPKAQLFGETPREEVEFALEWRCSDAERLPLLANEALRRADLLPLADDPWERLSGGQKQLAAFAAATALDAPLIVLDEATSMLDDAHRQAARRTVEELHARGAAIVWVTQRLDELKPEERVAAIGEGRLAFDGSVRDFLYGESGTGKEPLSPCLGAGLRLPYLPTLALELRRLGKLDDPLPVTEAEWQEAWRDAGNGEHRHAKR